MVITDVDADLVSRTAAEIGAAAGLAQDVRDPDSHRAVAQEASRHGELAVWVNNAGVGDDGNLADLSDEQVRRLVEVNLLGVMFGMRAAFEAFGSGGGDVVNLGSMSGFGPIPGLSAYAATKAAVISLTTSTAIEAPRGVRVHALCPDGVDTEMVASMDDGGTAKALIFSGGRILTVDEVAEAAVGLVGSRRVLRALPPWRAGAARFSALAPSTAAGGLAAFAAQGRRALRGR